MRQITVNGMRIKDEMTFEDVVSRLASVFPAEEIELVNYSPSVGSLDILRDAISHAQESDGTEREVYTNHARALFFARHSFGKGE